MSQATRPEVELKLDFEDLVQELDQFEREAGELQERISSFITTATEAAEGSESEGKPTDDIAEAQPEPQSVPQSPEPVIVGGPMMDESPGFANAAD